MSTQHNTGSNGRPWIELEPKPEKIWDTYTYWLKPPPEPSPRCQYWVRQIDRGWRPPSRWASWRYEVSAHLYGVYIWEYLNVIKPKLEEQE